MYDVRLLTELTGDRGGFFSTRHELVRGVKN
jgi:hypothetical protein